MNGRVRYEGHGCSRRVVQGKSLVRLRRRVLGGHDYSVSGRHLAGAFGEPCGDPAHGRSRWQYETNGSSARNALASG